MATRVEDTVDVSKCVEYSIKMRRIRKLNSEVQDRNMATPIRVSFGLSDVHSQIANRGSHVSQQLGSIECFDDDAHSVGTGEGRLRPLDWDHAAGFFLESANIRTVGPVGRDSPSSSHEANDLISGDGCATHGESNER